MKDRKPITLAYYTWTNGILAMAFGLLLLLPFYVHAIPQLFHHVLPQQDLPYDIAHFSPYAWPHGIGMTIRVINLLLLIFIPTYCIVSTLRSLWLVVSNQAIRNQPKNRVYIMISILTTVLLLSTAPVWWMIGYWIAD